MVPYKRPAGDKSGVPVYQPTGATTYQQLMQLQQPFVPVSCEYTGTPPLPAQSSNHQSVQNTIQSQGAAVNADTNGHGLLLDPNNPPPPPPAASSGDKQIAANHDTDNTQNSPELNHANSPQINHQLALPPPSMSPMTSMAGMTSMPSVVTMNPMVSMASMASVANMANMTSMANYTMANMANINVLSSLGMGPCLSIDPAALAKEVAQKNYAKALKHSQASQSYAMNHPLNALNYTGVALNKQALSIGNPHGAIPGTTAPRQVVSGLAGIHGGGLASHQLHQAGLLAYPRPPTSATFNPYSLIRQQMLPSSHPYMQTSLQGVPTASVHSAYLQSPYATMLPGVAGVPGVASQMQAMPQLPTASPATIAAQPQVALPNSSGVIMQPYKKMKTT